MTLYRPQMSSLELLHTPSTLKLYDSGQHDIGMMMMTTDDDDDDIITSFYFHV